MIEYLMGWVQMNYLQQEMVKNATDVMYVGVKD